MTDDCKYATGINSMQNMFVGEWEGLPADSESKTVKRNTGLTTPVLITITLGVVLSVVVSVAIMSTLMVSFGPGGKWQPFRTAPVTGVTSIPYYINYSYYVNLTVPENKAPPVVTLTLPGPGVYYYWAQIPVQATWTNSSINNLEIIVTGEDEGGAYGAYYSGYFVGNDLITITGYLFAEDDPYVLGAFWGGGEDAYAIVDQIAVMGALLVDSSPDCGGRLPPSSPPLFRKQQQQQRRL